MTIQFEGCGRQGLQVQLSEQFINDVKSGSARSKILLKNWAKFRYGVFDEHGFNGDRLYPLFWSTPGEDEHHNHWKTNGFHSKITSCAASSHANHESIDFTAKDSKRQPCSLKMNPMTGLPDEFSSCSPEVEGNEDIISSLMSHPTLKNNRFFCNQSTHNPRSPNKHNNLCEGRSVSEVILNHPDFKRHFKR